MEIRIGLASLTAGVIDDVNGLMILICLGTNGDASTFSMDVIEFEGFDVGVTNRNELVVDVGVLIDNRITRGLTFLVI